MLVIWFNMYLFFRCDCGRFLYAKSGVKTRKCVCGKTLKVKSRRILYKCEDVKDTPIILQRLQSEIYENTGFITGDKL